MLEPNHVFPSLLLTHKKKQKWSRVLSVHPKWKKEKKYGKLTTTTRNNYDRDFHMWEERNKSSDVQNGMQLIFV